MASSSKQSIFDLVVQSACEQADAITRLPDQLMASFATGDSAERRLGSIRSMCNRIRIGLLPVTNYIERNQPHLSSMYMRRIEMLLDGMQKCAIREIPEYSMPATKRDSPSGGARENAELAVVAMTLADWLRQWAEELRAKQGQTQGAMGSTTRDTPTPAGDEHKQQGPSRSLNDIPPLDKTNGEWVKQAEAARLLQLGVKTLANDRLRSREGRKSEDGLSGIDCCGRMWRKESANAKFIWYHQPSLSKNI